ncbi:MAG TPA: efflux RND transporter periplasmic adaptor subunit [Gammaproteobacteria bacterium]
MKQIYTQFMLYHTKTTLFTTLLLTLLVTACSPGDSDKDKDKKQAHLVETAVASIREVSIQQTLPGTLEAYRKVQVFNQEEGLLAKLDYFEGDKVSKGTLIATLDEALIKDELNKATATLKQAQLDFKRLNNLVPRSLASEDQIAKASTAVEIAKAEVSQYQTRLARTRILAPFDGIISERLVEPGDVLPMHQHILSVIDTSSLIARIYISELLLPLVNVGDPVEIKIDALGKQVFNGKVIRTHPTIDADTRRGVIEIELKPVPEGALPGQLCRVTLSTEKVSRLMIPFDAVRYDNTGSFVFVVQDNKAIRKNIKTGLQSQTDIEILDGVQEKDIVVTKGFFGLKTNAQVSISQSGKS